MLFALAACSEKESFTEQEKSLIFSEQQRGDILPLYTIDNPEEETFLRLIAKDLNLKELQSETYVRLRERMLATVKDTLNLGAGLAAPQIGISRNLITVLRYDKPDRPFEFFPNCEIIEYSDDKNWGREGCLSIPGKRDSVYRSTQVIIQYLDELSLQPTRDTINGYTAVIFQHEVDHLKGKLYIDYKED